MRDEGIGQFIMKLSAGAGLDLPGGRHWCQRRATIVIGRLWQAKQRAQVTMDGGAGLARATLAAWRIDYNTERPHSRLGWQTPDEFAQIFAPQRGLTLRNPQGSAPAPVAQPAQTGKTQTRSLAHAG